VKHCRPVCRHVRKLKPASLAASVPEPVEN
jgi:hypothetical protein